MTVDKEVAMKLWQDIFGNQLWAQDCFGTWMYREDYGKRDVLRNNRPNGTGKSFNYGWAVDHIMPKSQFPNEKDADFFNNFEPMHFLNNEKKSDKISFEINGAHYQVVKCEICQKYGLRGYGIKNIESNLRVDWKFTQNMYYR